VKASERRMGLANSTQMEGVVPLHLGNRAQKVSFLLAL
jgi:hypothetical protein